MFLPCFVIEFPAVSYSFIMTVLTGSVKENVLPLPISLSTQIRPWWRPMIFADGQAEARSPGLVGCW